MGGRGAFHGISKASMHNANRGRSGIKAKGNVKRVFGNEITLRPGERIMYANGRPVGVINDKTGTIKRFSSR